MSSSKAPVFIVASILCALIVLPVLLLIISRGSEERIVEFGAPSGGVPSGSATVGFDLRQLADRVDSLLENEMGQAVRNGDVSLDFVASLDRTAKRGREAMSSGKLEKARDDFNEVVQIAEAKLAELELADKARALNESTYAELSRLETLEPTFSNTYREAVETYNAALRALNAAGFEESIAGFEMTEAILGDLEARAISRIAGFLEAADAALADYELDAARTGFASVLEIDPSVPEAKEGLVKVDALEGIAEEVKAIRELQDSGQLEAALEQLDALAADHPGNAFLKSQRQAIKAMILDREFTAAVSEAASAEAAGNWALAISAMERALKLRDDPELRARLDALREKSKAARLEVLLADGFQALKTARYDDARELYKEAVGLAPDSKEARTGYEKASSLYLANIRYTQNLANARKYIEEGRFPLAAKFFNSAMSARPDAVSTADASEETSIRKILDAQSEEVSVIIKSDNRTFVSIIGVLPPGKLRTEELKLYPDVYTIRGSRNGYKDVEIEFKVDAKQPSPTIVVEADEKL